MAVHAARLETTAQAQQLYRSGDERYMRWIGEFCHLRPSNQ